jgi:hypothetical protein
MPAPTSQPPRPARRWRRLLAAATLCVVLLPPLALGAGILRMWPDPAPNFEDRRGRIALVERGSVERGDRIREDLRVVSSSGLEVEVAVLRPTSPGPHPLMVLLVGQRTGKEAVELFDDVGEVAVAAISYPYRGAHRFSFFEGLLVIPTLQTALLDTAPAVMLALDALLLEPYIDPGHIEMVGVSLGALMGPKIAALDGRFHRVWLMHGAGDVVELIAHQMRNRIDGDGLRRLVARGLAALAGAQHFAPELWVGRISPRELVFVNAQDDERMPRRCVEVLHANAAEPSEIIWLGGGHVRTVHREIVQELVELVLERMDAGVRWAPVAR